MNAVVVAVIIHWDEALAEVQLVHWVRAQHHAFCRLVGRRCVDPVPAAGPGLDRVVGEHAS